MQMITGDHYQQCEPLLARYCCKCENDSPVIGDSVCRHCKRYDGRSYMGHSKIKYGMTEKEFLNAAEREYRGGISRGRCIYTWRSPNLKDYRSSHWLWSTLESYMVEVCGSKMKWLRTLAKKDAIQKKALATRTQNVKRDAFLQSLYPWFQIYVRRIRFKETDKDVLEQCGRRFAALKAKLKERGFELQFDSFPCKIFIKTGKGSAEGVVETVVGSTKG